VPKFQDITGWVGLEEPENFTKLKVVIIENFVPELGVTLCYRVWRLAISYWRFAKS